MIKQQAVYMSSYGTFGKRSHYVDDRVIGVHPAVEETIGYKNKCVSRRRCCERYEIID